MLLKKFRQALKESSKVISHHSLMLSQNKAHSPRRLKSGHKAFLRLVREKDTFWWSLLWCPPLQSSPIRPPNSWDRRRWLFTTCLWLTLKLPSIFSSSVSISFFTVVSNPSCKTTPRGTQGSHQPGRRMADEVCEKESRLLKPNKTLMSHPHPSPIIVKWKISSLHQWPLIILSVLAWGGSWHACVKWGLWNVNISI